ncbi:HAMP domain-containing protein [Azospirillum sp. YIM B02556]|uniref:HAMP domain-containing protein n=1 Tax=Azospirillum endophyticum TaxID=2800326 RepID=A0ABS1F8X4_9PROT|nr:methyl-accepting chemotaxis protein [Azospirillum endophyticum]MBK1839854.1 HAMP domain-containing protein [Azospirillum endophyticum]
MLKNLRIAALTNLFGVVVTLGFLAVVVTGALAIRELKVGGPIYQRIVLGKDLIADILPPPEYVIEAYLEATLAMNEPASVEQRWTRLAQLRKDYDERHDYWLKESFEPALVDRLTRTSHAPVTRFWSEIETRFLPALAGKDEAAARASYAVIADAYAAHRAVVDRIVEETSRYNSETEVDAADRERLFMTAVWGVSALVLTVLVLGVLGIRRRVVRPVGELTVAMRALAQGNLATAIPGAERGDEIGAMAQALRVFKENAEEAERLRRLREEERERSEREKQAALLRMAETVETEASNAVDVVAGQTGLMADNATRMAESARAVSGNSQTVAAAATQALSNAQTVAAASEQLSASIREIAAQIGTATMMTGDAVGASVRAEETIRRLADAVTRIGEVTNLINDVAGQTNLLALNATIEAARAGEAGKGFAVVANEVKQLASQTARATDEIESQIAAIQATTAEAVDAVRAIAERVRGVEAVSATVAAAIEEQEAATGEIARNVVQTSTAAQEVATRIAAVLQEATATGERAGEVNVLSAHVATSIEQLRRVLIEAIRTATPEVNRRAAPRYPLHRPGRLIVGGRDLPATVDNASEGGAQLSGLSEQAWSLLAEGSAVGISFLPGLQPIPAVVRALDGGPAGRAHVTFTLAGADRDRFTAQFVHLVAGLVALDQAA